jgi:hypothetical protein
VLTLIVWGAVRFVAALRAWEVLVEFESSLSPLYLSATGAGWGVVGGMLLWSLFTGRRWAPHAVLTSGSLWLAAYWLERLFFQTPRANLPFALAGTFLLLGVTLMSALHKDTRTFFTRSEEHEQQTKNSSPE